MDAVESVLQAVWLNIGQTLQWFPPYYRDCGSSPKSSGKLPTGQLSSCSGTWEWFNWVLRNVAGSHVYTYYLAVPYSTIHSTFENPSRVRDKQVKALSLSSLNTSFGVPHVHKRGCGMRQVFTVFLLYVFRNMASCIFVSRQQRLLGLATVKIEVGSSSEAFVPVHRSTLRRAPGHCNSRSSVTAGPALDLWKLKCAFL